MAEVERRVWASQAPHDQYALTALAACQVIADRPPSVLYPMPLAVHRAAVAHIENIAQWTRTTDPHPATTGIVAESHALLAESWPALSNGGLTGEEMFRGTGLWPRMMLELPMVEYAKCAAEAVHFTMREDLPGKRIVELGAGHGNTTQLLRHTCFSYLATDAVKQRGVKVWDFDEWAWPPGDCGNPPDVLVATNAAHCSRDPQLLLTRCRTVLAPGGVLVLGEGNRPGGSWYQDALYSTMRGWYDRGGFRTPDEWAMMLHRAGFTSQGRVHLYCGDLDLGGAYWGTA